MDTQNTTNDQLTINPNDLVNLKKDEIKPELVSLAEDNIKGLINFNFEDIDEQIGVENTVDSIGLDLQREVSRKSSLLTTTVGDMGNHTESGDLAKALLSLRNQVESVNPSKHKLEPGSLTRIVGKLFPKLLSRPMQNYMTKFRTAESVINEIVGGIEEGQRMLERDNITLQDKIVELRKLDAKIKNAITVGQLMDTNLCEVIDQESDPEKKKFLQNKVLVKLRTRILDLQTVRSVAHQGILSMDLAISTNKQLVQNAERTRTVTVAALKIAVELRKALSNQKQILDLVNSVNNTTNDILLGNSELLKNNSVEISKKSMQSTLDLDKLRTAFNNIYSAIEETDKLREEALPSLKSNIQEFNVLAENAERKINSIDNSNKLESKVNLKIDA